jgi:hypothetical protein
MIARFERVAVYATDLRVPGERTRAASIKATTAGWTGKRSDTTSPKV